MTHRPYLHRSREPWLDDFGDVLPWWSELLLTAVGLLLLPVILAVTAVAQDRIARSLRKP